MMSEEHTGSGLTYLENKDVCDAFWSKLRSDNNNRMP